MKTKEEIYQKLKNKIPLVRENGCDFLEFINDQLGGYCDLARRTYKNSFDFKLMKDFIDCLDNVFYVYYEKSPNESFDIFKSHFQKLINFYSSGYDGILPIINNSFSELNCLKNEEINYYFRISNYSSSLLHIPFEYKEYIRSNRFTHEEIPCFYGANSIITCFKELGNSVSVDSFISCFQYDYARFPILDLTMPAFNVYENREQFLDRYILSWPIIALCMIRKNSAEEKPIPFEYIIPQFILKVLSFKDLGPIRSVRYYSTKNHQDKVGINIAIPTTNVSLNSGYCSDLSNVFMDEDRDPFSPNFCRMSKPIMLKDLGVNIQDLDFTSIEDRLKNEINYLS
jgi:hypothetical protein